MTSFAPPVDGSAAEPYPRRWWALGVLALSLVLIGLDNTIVNVALPTFVRELDATNSQLQWIVDSYVLVFAGLLLTAGAIGDRFGRKGALNLGLGIFLVGALLSASSQSAEQLIVTRGLMGVGGAFIMPATLSILTNIFPPEERPKAIALWAATAGIGIPLGPVLGGWLLEHFWWGSTFLVNVPIVVAAFLLGQLLIPTSRARVPQPLDPPGAVLSFAGLSTLVYTLIEAPVVGWTSNHTFVTLAVAVVLLAAFMWRELHTAHPMLDMRFFRSARFSAANLAITLIFFAMFGSFFSLTQYLQFVQGYTPLEAGVRMMPVAIGLIVGAPASARLVERFGSKIVVAAGMTMTATGLFLLALLDVDSSYAQLLAAMMVMSLGMGLSMAPATESIMGAIPRSKAGVGSAMNDTTRQLGGAFGVAVIGSVISSAYRSGLDGLAGTVPASALSAARESLGGALASAAALGPSGVPLASAARSSFVDAMSTGLMIGAAIALLGALVALVFLPAHGEDVGEEFADAFEPAEALAVRETVT